MLLRLPALFVSGTTRCEGEQREFQTHLFNGLARARKHDLIEALIELIADGGGQKHPRMHGVNGLSQVDDCGIGKAVIQLTHT